MLNIMPIIISIMPQFKLMRSSSGIGTLVYIVHFIITAACCNTNTNKHGAFFKVESEVTVVVVLLLPPSSQCFARCF